MHTPSMYRQPQALWLGLPADHLFRPPLPPCDTSLQWHAEVSGITYRVTSDEKLRKLSTILFTVLCSRQLKRFSKACTTRLELQNFAKRLNINLFAKITCSDSRRPAPRVISFSATFQACHSHFR